MTKDEYLEALTDLMMHFFITIQKQGELRREDLKSALVSFDNLVTNYEETMEQNGDTVSTGPTITIPIGASASSW